MKNRKIVIGIDGSGIDDAIKAVDEYERWLMSRANELAKRLAEMGALNAQFYFDGAQYFGNTDCSISIEQTGENTYLVKADGESVLFIEFGAGITYGYGHPEAKTGGNDFGPGTWPDKHYRVGPGGKLVANWENPNGWYLPKSKGGGHTYGNPPNAFMYNAVKDLKQELKAVIQEVFSA